jgi:hypothetical protein
VFTFFKNMNGKENEQVQVESDFEATRVCGWCQEANFQGADGLKDRVGRYLSP